MTDVRWRQVKALFQATVDRSPAERAAFLAAATGTDEALRRQVESLLSSDAEAASFLDWVPLAAEGVLGAPDSLKTAGGSAGERWLQIMSYLQSGASLEDPVQTGGHERAGGWEGRRIGPYDVGPRIGAGGMGEVYRAQDTRLNRTVAIKVRADRLAWRPDLREQFAREAKAISGLNHPHICLLHDVGQHDSIDFLVMEHVDGERIDVYCDRRGLNVPQRLALFRCVVDAVHYAHQNLVVHRDLKPANILVTGDGQPKLLDFGIAKLVAAGSPGDTVTAFSPELTPDYASPEQVRGETVTTATDVYSLGVVLYELLAGCRPFTVRTASLEDIVHIVCQTDATPPSVARRALNASSTVSFRAARELQGDLDTIVLKALRKEPERRYLSAQALSDDIKQYLAGQPVGARGDALIYRLSKFMRRNRVAALVASLFVASLLAAMALILGQSHIAEAQRQRAERRFADVRRLAGSFLFEFHDAIKQLPGSTRARQLVAQRALEYLDSLAEESADDPTLRAELARAYQRAADVQGAFREANLGNVGGALASYRKALALQEGLLSAGSADPSLQRDLAGTLIGLGDAQLMVRDMPAALDSFRRSLAIREALTAAGARDRDAQRELAVGHHRVADVLGQLGDLDAAVSGMQRAIAILESLAADDPDNDSRYALARSYKALGGLRAILGDYEGNLAMVQRALRLNEALATADPLNMKVRNEVAVSALELGRAYQRLNNLADALRSFRRAEELTASMATADASDAQPRWMQGLEINLIGVTLRDMRRHTEAVAAHLEALALLDGVSRVDPANENYHYNVANTYQLIGDAYVALARDNPPTGGRGRAWMNARSWYRRSADTFDAMRRRGTLTGSFVNDADAVKAGLARCARELGEATPNDTAR